MLAEQICAIAKHQIDDDKSSDDERNRDTRKEWTSFTQLKEVKRVKESADRRPKRSSSANWPVDEG